MNPQTLTFENGVVELDLPTLKRTLPYENARGDLPKSRPVEHTVLIEMVEQMIQNKVPGIASLDAIYAGESQSMRVGHKDKTAECPVEKFLVQRIVTRINLPGGIAGELNPSIALSYSESGIMVSFGMRVHVCKNLSIFGDNLWSTFGENKVPFDKGMEVLSHWLETFEERTKRDLALIQKMKEIVVDEITMDRIVGRLIRNAVIWNGGDKTVNAPLNVTQVNRMIEEGHDFFKKNQRDANVWEIANFGTSILKPESADMVHVLRNNQKLNNFMCETFQLN